MPEEPLLKKLVQAELSCTPKAFWRAATQRLDAARLLLESQGGSHLDAVYLAGYVVECALKALILARTPAKNRAATCQELTSGAKPHNFDFLRWVLSQKGCPLPEAIRFDLKILRDRWSTDLRYAAKLVSYREAKEFMKRVQSIYEWVERTL